MELRSHERRLPSSRTPETWRRWLYAHAPRGDVPGAVKLAGRWHFRAEEARAWIEQGGGPAHRPKVMS